MNFKGQKIHDAFQSPLYDTFYTKVDDEVWGAVWEKLEDQVWVGTGGSSVGSSVDEAIYFKLVEYEFCN